MRSAVYRWTRRGVAWLYSGSGCGSGFEFCRLPFTASFDSLCPVSSRSGGSGVSSLSVFLIRQQYRQAIIYWTSDDTLLVQRRSETFSLQRVGLQAS